MNRVPVFTRLPDQHACLAHLEAIRWGEEPSCPFCTSPRGARKAEKRRSGRWTCHACKASFNVLSGTLFEKTKIPLQKWFVAIRLIVNAKKSLSSYQLGRALDLNQPSAWYMHQRIRAAMHADQADLLRGIVEADVRSFMPHLQPSGSNTFRRSLGNAFAQGDGQADDADGHQLLSGPGSSPRPQSPVPPALPKWTLCPLSDEERPHRIRRGPRTGRRG